MEVSDTADHSSTGTFNPDTGRFLVSGPADREAAVAKAAALYQKDPDYCGIFQHDSN